MSAYTLKPWVEVVSLHPDVTSENFSEDIFALDLGPLADGNPKVPAVYRDPEHFFRVSYLTKGLRSLLQDVLSRLEGGAGNRVLKLITPFGGGKSHTLGLVAPCRPKPQCARRDPRGQGAPQTRKVRLGRLRRAVLRCHQRQGDPRREIPRPHDVGLDRLVPGQEAGI